MTVAHDAVYPILMDALYVVKVDEVNTKSEGSPSKEVTASRQYLSSQAAKLDFYEHENQLKNVSFIIK